MAVSGISCIVVFMVMVYRGSGQCPGIIQEPVNTIGTVGKTASMFIEACQSKNPPREVVAWEKYIPGSGDQRIWASDQLDSIDGAETYNVSYPDDLGKIGRYELVFIKAELNDAGKYKAKFLLGQSPQPQGEAVFVVVDSMANSCPEENQRKVEGEEISMVCEVEFRSAGDILPQLTWDSVQGTDTKTGNVGTSQRLRSEARFNATAADHNQNFVCQLRLNDEIHDFCTTHYNVEYRVSEIMIDPDVDGILKVEVGDVIKCSAQSNPSPSYSWTCGGSIIQGADLIIIDEYKPGTSCTCTAQNRIKGVDKSKTRIVSFTTGEGGEEVQPSTGSIMRNKSPKSVPPENGIPSSEKPSYDNRNFQGSNSNIQPKAAPGYTNMVQPPQYGNITQQGYPGKGSPGYADLGVKHLSGSLPGSTSTINSIPDQHTSVNKDPSGVQLQGASRKGEDTSV